tara:strand:+ start:243 stop:491 length:249 start_codon:yes stop_codon:yes gene_type:complete
LKIGYSWQCRVLLLGEFPDQGDAKWIVIREQVWGHNDTRCGQPALAGLSAAWGLAAQDKVLKNRISRLDIHFYVSTLKKHHF